MSINPKTKRLTFIPPDKGSFPLDHDNVCKELMKLYMDCLRLNNRENTKCRQEIKNYLACRMEHNLMAEEEWSKLGLADEDINQKREN